MILRTLIERIKTPYNKGIESDDTRLSARYIYSKLLSSRNRLIAQQARKNQRISQWVYQTLPCVELIKAPIHECPCLPPVGCTIYRTKHPLPHTLSDLSNHLIQSVSTVDGSITFNEIGWEEKKHKAFNRFTSHKPDYFLRGNHLYITQPTGPTLITITGLWDDPIQATKYPSKCDDCVDCVDCTSPLDMDFPIDGDMVDTMIEMAREEILGDFARAVEDKTNDTSGEEEDDKRRRHR